MSVRVANPNVRNDLGVPSPGAWNLRGILGMKAVNGNRLCYPLVGEHAPADNGRRCRTIEFSVNLRQPNKLAVFLHPGATPPAKNAPVPTESPVPGAPPSPRTGPSIAAVALSGPAVRIFGGLGASLLLPLDGRRSVFPLRRPWPSPQCAISGAAHAITDRSTRGHRVADASFCRGRSGSSTSAEVFCGYGSWLR